MVNQQTLFKKELHPVEQVAVGDLVPMAVILVPERGGPVIVHLGDPAVAVTSSNGMQAEHRDALLHHHLIYEILQIIK